MEGYYPTHHGTREVPPGYICLPSWVIYAGYSRVVLPVVHTVVMLVPCVHRVVDGITLLVMGLREGGLCEEGCASLHLRINLSPGRKRAINGKETRHRKHLCTRKP